jgi:hypothetical protein
VVCDGLVGSHDALIEQPCGWGSPHSLHVLDETRQLGQLLRDLRLGDESALALLTSTRPRSTKFWIAFLTVVRLTLNRATKPSSGGNWVSGGKLPSAISPARTVSTRS